MSIECPKCGHEINAEGETCKWHRGISFGFACYVTDCGNSVNVRRPIPADDHPNFCANCGRPVEIVERDA